MRRTGEILVATALLCIGAIGCAPVDEGCTGDDDCRAGRACVANRCTGEIPDDEPGSEDGEEHPGDEGDEDPDEGECAPLEVQTYRDEEFTPVDRFTGDSACASVFAGTHWCTLEEVHDRDLVFGAHGGNRELGTRQLAFSPEIDGCGGGVACSNNFSNPATAGCGLTPGCENMYCTGEALLCCN